jgi:hypothetical protein
MAATMNPRLTAVAPLSDHRLLLTFDNAESRVFDVKPYLTKGVFSELADESFFRSAHVCSTPWRGPTEQTCARRSCMPQASRTGNLREGERKSCCL